MIMMTKIVDLINRRITHNRDRVEDGKAGDFGIRVVVHIPIGFLMGLLIFCDWGLVQMFLKYQRNEDAHHEDEAWKDIYGAMVGFVPGRVIAVVVVVYLIFRVVSILVS